ncbi:MAG: stage III sporulation protein AA [Clostridia bacterium]|nr:stage III sporulation protein AA [Clostridia bacterium]
MDEFLKLFPGSIRREFERLAFDIKELEEVRIRVGQPVFIHYRGKEWAVCKSGELESYQPDHSYLSFSDSDIKKIIDYLCDFSVYSYEDEIKKGYLTVPGGHRIGLCGGASMEGGQIKTLRYITYLNIRIAHEVKGVADPVMRYLFGSRHVHNTLIISPPGLGKTTLLRDIIRQASDGTHANKGYKVALVDERSEIAGCYHAIPQNDVGIRTDVLDGSLKAEGMLMLLRSMSPQIIAVDEIGGTNDVHALEEMIRSGCSMIATVHADSMEDLLKKEIFHSMMQKHFFTRFILITGKCRMERQYQVYDEELRELYHTPFRLVTDQCS